MDVGTDEIAVAEVDAGRRDGAGDHIGGLFEIVLVVRTAARAVGVDERWLAAAARSAAALGVVGGRGRHVAQVDDVQLGDVDAQFHGGRAEQQWKLGAAEILFAFLAIFGGDLGGVLAGFEPTFQVDEAAVALDEVAVAFGRDFARVEQAGFVERLDVAVAGEPAEGVGVELIAGVGAALHLFHDAIAFEGEE